MSYEVNINDKFHYKIPQQTNIIGNLCVTAGLILLSEITLHNKKNARHLSYKLLTYSFEQMGRL